MQRLLIATIVAALVATTGPAQEANDGGGAMTSRGLDPDPTCVFLATETLDFEIHGAPGVPYILAMGSYSPGQAFFGAESVDLDLPTAMVLGDGIGLSGLLPPVLFALDGAGFASWSFPLNAVVAGLPFTFQAIVQDATSPAFGLNATAAAQFVVGANPGTLGVPANPGLMLTGDETFGTYTFAAGPYTFYGQQWTECHVSTNGWVTFGAPPTSADYTESIAHFVGGAIGLMGATGRPAMCPMWEDLDFGNMTHPQQGVYVVEDAVNHVLTVTWYKGDFFPSTPFGSVICTLDENGGQPIVTYDYTHYIEPNFTPMNGPLIGITDGDLAQANGQPGGADLQVDLSICPSAGPTPYTSTADYETLLQLFDGNGQIAADLIDIGIINFADQTGNGRWTIY